LHYKIYTFYEAPLKKLLISPSDSVKKLLRQKDAEMHENSADCEVVTLTQSGVIP